LICSKTTKNSDGQLFVVFSFTVASFLTFLLGKASSLGEALGLRNYAVKMLKR